MGQDDGHLVDAQDQGPTSQRFHHGGEDRPALSGMSRRAGYELFLRSSATIAGTISWRSPITAQSARATIGAFRSLLITRIRLAPLQPTMCWIAPLTPHAM